MVLGVLVLYKQNLIAEEFRASQLICPATEHRHFPSAICTVMLNMLLTHWPCCDRVVSKMLYSLAIATVVRSLVKLRQLILQ
jgi:hypothetical protein